jgi:uncharacterized protein YbjT (DUF2867 family)
MTQRPVLLFGASRGVGRELADRMRARGVDVTALVRPASDTSALDALGVRVVRGDALAADDVARAFAAAPAGAAVVSTLGSRAGEPPAVDEAGNRIVIDRALAMRSERLVLVTAIGCGEMAVHRSARARAAFGTIVDAKTRAERHLRRTGLPYTILRPGGLRDGAPTGRGMLTRDPRVHGFLRRADLAVLIERVLRDRGTLGRALAAVDLDQARGEGPIEPFPLAQG